MKKAKPCASLVTQAEEATKAASGDKAKKAARNRT